MRYCRFQFQGQVQHGLVEFVAGTNQITHLLVNPPEESGSLQNITTKPIEPVLFSEATLLASVRPSKIVCVGRNYRAHAAEMGGDVPKEPLIFFKPPSSLIATGETIRRPKASKNTHYEGELGVVIAKPCYKLRAQADVRPYILGYTAVNDITARDLQKTDGQWTRAKGFDTFCPVGPLVTDEIDPWTGRGQRPGLDLDDTGVIERHGGAVDEELGRARAQVGPGAGIRKGVRATVSKAAQRAG